MHRERMLLGSTPTQYNPAQLSTTVLHAQLWPLQFSCNISNHGKCHYVPSPALGRVLRCGMRHRLLENHQLAAPGSETTTLKQLLHTPSIGSGQLTTEMLGLIFIYFLKINDVVCLMPCGGWADDIQPTSDASVLICTYPT